MRSLLTHRSGRICVSLTAAFYAAFSTASAATFSFHQVDWLSDSGGYTSQNSDWGIVDMQFTHSDLSAFRYDAATSTYSGYINVVTNVQNGATMNWAVQNLPIQFHSITDFDGALPQSATFNLGVTPGVNVTNLGYTATIDMDPIGAIPPGSFAAASVDDESVLFGGLTGTDPVTGQPFSGTSGQNPPPPASNTVGAQPGQKQGAGGSIKLPDNKIAAIDEDLAGCAPGSVARSIKYLQTLNKQSIPPIGSPQDVYNELKNDMHTVTGAGPQNGTLANNVILGKDQFNQAHGVPIVTKTETDIQKAIDALNSGSDVEIAISFHTAQGTFGHLAFVSQIIPVLDQNNHVVSYTITYLDDRYQGNHKATNNKETLIVNAGGNGSSGNVLGFFVENVVPEPSSIAAMIAGPMLLLLLAIFRRKNISSDANAHR